jgi:hypothetical protein
LLIFKNKKTVNQEKNNDPGPGATASIGRRNEGIGNLRLLTFSLDFARTRNTVNETRGAIFTSVMATGRWMLSIFALAVIFPPRLADTAEYYEGKFALAGDRRPFGGEWSTDSTAKIRVCREELPSS